MKAALNLSKRVVSVFFAYYFALICVSATAAGEPAKARDFLFTYRTTVTDLAPGQLARIWLPVPPSNADQAVRIVNRDLPADGTMGREAKYDNHILYVEARPTQDGRVSVAVTYRVQRNEVKGERGAKNAAKEEVERYLQADARVPVQGRPLTLLAGKTLPSNQLQLGRVLYDVVNSHMRDSKEGIGWGEGDSVWACDSKYGNCSDFHSLFISLAQSQKIPAVFEIGFPLPEARGQGEITGYHCWAKFKPAGSGWIPVDISEANKNPQRKDYYFGNLTEDRVTFSVGRDLILVPKQAGPLLNFFVYPYVEVDGKPYPADKIQKRFTYEDVKAGSE